MQGGNGTDAVPATYGTDQGYSEDYGAPSMKPAGGGTLSNDNYGAGKDDQRGKNSLNAKEQPIRTSILEI